MARSVRLRIEEKSFTGSGCVLRDLSIELAPGEALAIRGPSGSGKSTLLRIAAGLDTAFHGKVEGRPGSIGFQFQSPHLLPWRSALDNVTLACGNTAAATYWLERAGVAYAAALLPRQLSFGMARRVGLARALAVAPALLLLDEPTSGLDPEAAARVHETIMEALARFRPITLIATHSGEEARVLATRHLLLGSGEATA